MSVLVTPMPRSSSLSRDGYIPAAANATWAAGGVERTATPWVCMRDRKDGSVGVGWDGPTQPTETKDWYWLVPGYETESHICHREEK